MVGGRTLGGRARYLDSLVNRTNTSGGVKKQGLPSTVGVDASVGGIYRKRIGCLCPTAYDFISNTRTCTYIGKVAGSGGRC